MTSDAPMVHVIDDDPSVQKSLRRLLISAGFNVDVFSSAEDYLCRGHGDGPGCLLVDVKMPGINGMELQEVLRKRGSLWSLIFLTGHGDIRMGVDAIKRGAYHFLTKPVDETDLLSALNQALDISKRACSERDHANDIQKRLGLLTPREQEVMRCVLAGALNKQIAKRLEIAEKTVKVHRARVMEKMGVESVAELVRLCEFIGVQPTEISP